MTQQMIHIFEAANLGKGPFRLSHVTSEGGHCEFCGTPIVWRFYISGADERVFFVGSDCVMKTDDAGLKRIVEIEVRKRLTEQRHKREALKIDELMSLLEKHKEVLAAKPHPWASYSSRGKTLLDFINGGLRYGGTAQKLKLLKLVKQNLL